MAKRIDDTAPPTTRRRFVQDLALGSAAVALGTAAGAPPAGAAVVGLVDQPSLAPRPVPRPADGGVARSNLHRVADASGIPLGGVGTGSVEIRSDGYFHEWMIMNLGPWAAESSSALPAPQPEMDAGALAFFLRAKPEGGAPLVRRLGTRTDQHELYSLSWAKSVEAIEFDTVFPAATLRYQDRTLPVAVSATMFSPFIPHDARTSGTPGFHVAFTVHNTSKQRVSVSIAAKLKNPLAWGADDRQLRQTVAEGGGTTYLTMRTDAQLPNPETVGSLGLSVTGGEASWIAGDFGPYVGNGFWRRLYASFLKDFRETGRLPSLAPQASPAGLLRLTDEQIDALSLGEKQSAARTLRGIASFAALYDRFARVEGPGLESNDALGRYLKYAHAWLDALAGRDRKGARWGDVALCGALELAPGEERVLRFTVGWHFPHHMSPKGTELGHMYEHWFADAEAVSRFLVANYAAHREATLAFVHALAGTTIGAELAEAWSAQLSTLVKCTWWTRDGQFAVWEGFGCCGFQTMDVSYQGSGSIIAFFPELQEKQLEMSAAFQRADGRVPHFFTPDFSAVDDQFERVDMNPQFVLLACRDFLWKGDRDYLGRMWPHVQRAIANTALLDADGDGLPDHDTRLNTYDAWDFYGTPSYIASLWLASLKAGARLADEVGDAQTAARWRDWLRKGAESFDRKLWNGEYYSLWVDGDRRDECCMTDQLSGEWYTQLMGLGQSLPRDRIVAALRAVVRHNFSLEQGLLNATYPASAKARFPTYENPQASGNWTGVEYAIAAMMMDFGLVEEGVAVVRAVSDRYARAGRIWNHVECGDHYYRAMCSWATLLAATGFKVDRPRGVLTVAPVIRVNEVRAPWMSATAWGELTQTARRFELACRSGEETFRQLRLNLRARSLGARLNGRSIPCKVSDDSGYRVLDFGAPITVGAGQVLAVTA
jgi:uncharacterized protein (DUF608 family)